MKELAQTLLILGGILGMLAAIPLAIYEWFEYRSIGGDLTTDDRLRLASPAICFGLVALGLIWRKLQNRGRRSRRFTIGDSSGGDSGGEGGGD